MKSMKPWNNEYRISVFFSQIPNFRFIHDSHRSAKKKNPRKFPPFGT